MRVQGSIGVCCHLISNFLLKVSFTVAVFLVISNTSKAEAKTGEVSCRSKKCLSSSEIKTKLRRAGKRLATRKRTTFQVEISPKKINALINASTRKSLKPVKIQLPTSNGVINIQLKPTDIISPNYIALESSKNGIQILPANFYTFFGKASSTEKDDFLALTVFESGSGTAKVEGLFKGRGKLYTLKSETKKPLAAYKGSSKRVPNKSEPFEMREVRPSDLRAMMRQVPIDKVHRALKAGHSSTRSTLGTGATPQGIIEAYIATDIDFSYLKQIKSVNNPTAANARIVSIINSVNGIYSSQLGIKLKISFQHVWTKPDPYGPGGEDLLYNFAEYWKENFENTTAYTAAHLFTNKSLGGGVIGLAYINGACERGIKYGASRYSDSNIAGPLFAHELGHNLGANHDMDYSRWIMYPYISTGQQNFSSTSISSISGHVRAVYGQPGCFRQEATVLSMPPKVEVVNFRLINGKAGIELSFNLPNDASNISGISLFRSEESSAACAGVPLVQSIGHRSYFDPTAEMGKVYYYSVRSIGWDNQLSECSVPQRAEVSEAIPRITSFGPYYMSAKAGDTVQYRVETSNNASNLVYEWLIYSLKNGVPADPQRIPNVTGPVLTISNVNSSHNQKYFGVVVKLGSEGVASPLGYLVVE